ncbi:hypothetical protein B0J13DRAFT_538593 [Dactylonectria estremocensis]|uniref:NAD(P)-binding protein n=1 Tax=Dactylonectria estremocensis TaxID=1079267 RepID=A0A9P9FJH7_9HYPO|nr:hypothetical protein B0J13DRAFT_538593 [Dactylonectria estremocensis]
MASSNFVWFITGANSGFGLLLAELALSKGHTVVATARSLSKFPQSLQKRPNTDLVEIQITAPASEIEAAVDAAVSKHGRIDVLVNNAGFGLMGAVEEVTEEEARYQFDVNFFGLFNFTRAAIPHMRKQGSGVIIQISSGAGIWAGHGGPVYAASKFAIEGLSEGMNEELKPFGIRVHIIEPGIFRTEFLKPSSEGKNVASKKDGYLDIGGILGGMHGKQPGNPEKGVQRIYEVATGTGAGAGMENQLRVPLGSDCFGMLQSKIQQLTETMEKGRDMAISTDY